MTTIRRVLVLIGLTLAVTVGAAIPASATFADSVKVVPTVATAVVAPPTGVNGTVTCYDRATWYGTERRMTGTVRWTASTSAAVNLYRVQVVVPGMTTMQFDTNQLSVTLDEAAFNASVPVSVTVTAITSYGWFKAANPITVYTCLPPSSSTTPPTPAVAWPASSASAGGRCARRPTPAPRSASPPTPTPTWWSPT